MRRHRDVARISLGRIPAGPTLARYSEWLFELLQPVGIPDQVIAYLGDLMGLYIGAFAFEESLGIASPTGEDLPPDQIVQMFRDYVASLPDDRFPAHEGRGRSAVRRRQRRAVRVRPRRGESAASRPTPPEPAQAPLRGDRPLRADAVGPNGQRVGLRRRLREVERVRRGSARSRRATSAAPGPSCPR